jgi:hypothetical protein
MYKVLLEQFTELNKTVKELTSLVRSVEIALVENNASVKRVHERVDAVELAAAAAHKRIDEGQSGLIRWFAGIAAAIALVFYSKG